MSDQLDNQVKAAIGWTDINKREEAVKSLIQAREREAELKVLESHVYGCDGKRAQDRIKELKAMETHND